MSIASPGAARDAASVMAGRKIAINTGGGDAPGLNAVIRAATLGALERGWEVWGIRQGYRGLIDDAPDGLIRLDRERVEASRTWGAPSWAPRTGAIRSTTRRQGETGSCPGIGPRISCGGSAREGSTRSSRWGATARCGSRTSCSSAWLPLVIGVPKTIDNDVCCTDLTFGFDTAVSIATEALDRLHTTTEAHERIMVVEVMGRHAGWIALNAGIAGGADAILMPEIRSGSRRSPRRSACRESRGRRFSIVVAAEGAHAQGAS